MQRRNFLAALLIGTTGGSAMAGPTRNFNDGRGPPLVNPHAAVFPEVEKRGVQIVRLFGDTLYDYGNRAGLDSQQTTTMLAKITQATVITKELHTARLSEAVHNMRATGQAQAFGTAIDESPQRHELGVVVRPDGSTLVMLRHQAAPGRSFTVPHAMEIDANGRARVVAQPNLSEFGIRNERAPMEIKVRPAGEPAPAAPTAPPVSTPGLRT